MLQQPTFRREMNADPKKQLVHLDRNKVRALSLFQHHSFTNGMRGDIDPRKLCDYILQDDRRHLKESKFSLQPEANAHVDSPAVASERVIVKIQVRYIMVHVPICSLVACVLACD
jgi:hypothetical protein